MTTAVFSVFDWVLVRPLPYPSPHEIVRVSTAGLSPATEPADLTHSEFISLSEASAFRATTALSTATRVLAGQGLEPSHVVVARVSGDLFNAQLAGAFGQLAWLLAGIGVDGLTAGEVSGRWQELAIRVALGASRRAALWSAIQPATTAVVAGMSLGFLATLALGRWITALLYDVRPADPATLVTVAGGLGALGLIAATTAARGVLRADAAEVLRAQ